MNRGVFQKTALLLVVIAISALFFAMIRDFFITLLLAAIFAGMLQRPYSALLRLFHGRKTIASLCAILLFVLVIVVPLLGFTGIVANEALQVSKSAGPWIEEQMAQPDSLYEKLRALPGFERIEPYRDAILKKAAGLAGTVGNFAVRGLSAATSGTISFLFQFFIFLYALFFFLMDGKIVLRKILYYLPLTDRDEAKLVNKFSSVTRATLKGTLVIGIIQGALAGVGLAVVGVGGAVFWGTVMVVLSIIPGIGTALVWGPTALYLVAVGRPFAALFLALYCGLVVGSVDNILRPRLVGKDVKMPDLMILLGTLGGIFMFGVVGFIVGPVIAALFITIWEIYGGTFRYALVSHPPSTRRRK